MTANVGTGAHTALNEPLLAKALDLCHTLHGKGVLRDDGFNLRADARTARFWLARGDHENAHDYIVSVNWRAGNIVREAESNRGYQAPLLTLAATMRKRK